MLDSPISILNFEFLISCSVLLIIYLFPRFKYTHAQNILRTPSNVRQGILALTVFIVLIIYHGYLISSQPSAFIKCEPLHCQVRFFDALFYLLGYQYSGFEFTEFGQHSRLIFTVISLSSLAIAFSFYSRHLSETQALRDQILHLKRKSIVLLEQYENPAYDSNEEFTTLHLDYDLPKMGLSDLNNSILEYRADPSIRNLNLVISNIKNLKDI